MGVGKVRWLAILLGVLGLASTAVAETLTVDLGEIFDKSTFRRVTIVSRCVGSQRTLSTVRVPRGSNPTVDLQPSEEITRCTQEYVINADGASRTFTMPDKAATLSSLLVAPSPEPHWVYYAGTQPATANDGDAWFDNGNDTLYVYKSGTWVQIRGPTETASNIERSQLSSSLSTEISNSIPYDGVSYDGDVWTFASHGGQTETIDDVNPCYSEVSGTRAAGKVLKATGTAGECQWADDDTASGGSGLDAAGVRSQVAAQLQEGTNVSLTSSGSGATATLTIAATDTNTQRTDADIRSQVEGTIVAGTNVTVTPSGSGAARQITINATASGGDSATSAQELAVLAAIPSITGYQVGDKIDVLGSLYTLRASDDAQNQISGQNAGAPSGYQGDATTFSWDEDSENIRLYIPRAWLASAPATIFLEVNTDVGLHSETELSRASGDDAGDTRWAYHRAAGGAGLAEFGNPKHYTIFLYTDESKDTPVNLTGRTDNHFQRDTVSSTAVVSIIEGAVNPVALKGNADRWPAAKVPTLATLGGITSSQGTTIAEAAITASGAEANVNADWDATSGDAQILNKPTVPEPYTVGSGLSQTGQELSAVAVEPLSGDALPDAYKPGELFRLTAGQDGYHADRAFQVSQETPATRLITLNDVNGIAIGAIDNSASVAGLRNRVFVQIPPAHQSQAKKPTSVALYPDGTTRKTYTVSQTPVSGSSNDFLVNGITYSDLTIGPLWRVNLIGSTFTYTRNFAAGLWVRGGDEEEAWVASDLGTASSSASLAETASGSEVVIHTPLADGWSSWQTVVTAAATSRGGVVMVMADLSGVLAASTAQSPQVPLAGGGDRVQSAFRIVRVRNQQQTVLAEIIAYGPRNVANADAALPLYIAATRQVVEQIQAADTSETGDVYLVQARHIDQSTTAQRQVTYASGANKIKVVSF